MSNIPALYLKEKALRRRMTLISALFWLIFLWVLSSIIIGAIAAAVAAMATWWAYTERVDEISSIYHIGDK